MGYLINPSCPIDFSSGFTLSGWFRIPSPVTDTDNHILFEFGNNAAFAYPSSISYYGGNIYCELAGRSFAHPHLDWWVGEETPPGHWGKLGPNYATIEAYVASGGGGPGFSFSEGTDFFRGADETTDASAAALALAEQAREISVNPPDVTILCESRPSTLWDALEACGGNWHTPFYNVVSDTGPFSLDLWHHVLIAVDCSGGIVDQAEVLAGPHDYTTLNSSLTKTSPFFMIVDAVSAINYSSHSWPSGKTKGQVFTSYVNSSGFDINLNPTGSGIVAAGYPLYLPCNPAPSSELGVNGTGVLEGPVLKEYGDFQVWNKFIDPTVPANYAKFVKISGGKGKPVNPAVAANAFGAQAILFRGNSSNSGFLLNRGTAGGFSKVGSAADFTPTPSYG